MIKVRYVTLLLSILFGAIFQYSNAQNACSFDTNPADLGATCDKAPHICGGLMDGYQGKLASKEDGTNQPSPLCNGDGTAENMQWFAFTPCENYIRIKVTPSNCENPKYPELGIQGGIYTNCDFDEAIACASDFTQSPIILESNVTPGQTYYLFIDGYTGSICEYTIDVIEGINTDPITFDSNGGYQIEGDNDICTDGFSAHTYNVTGECNIDITPGCTNPEDYIQELKNQWFCYEWTITPSTGWIINGDQNTKDIDIVWESPGNYSLSCEIKLHPFLESNGNACIIGEPCAIEQLEVKVDEPNPINLPKVYLCEGDSTLFCGQFIKTAGVYQCEIPNSCSYHVQIVEMKKDSIEDLGDIYLCPGECFTLNGVQYCDEGNYDIVSDQCNIKYIFNLNETSIDAEVLGIQELDCDTESFIVQANVTTNSEATLQYKWFLDNNEIGNNNLYSITKPGSYKLKVYIAGYESNCFDEFSFEVIENLAAPEISLSSGILTCDVDSIQINLASNISLSSVAWTGKNSFTSNVQNPMVKDSGTYEVIVTGTNGCTASSSIKIEANYPPAEVDIDFEHLNCDIVSTQLAFTADIAIDSLLWTGPEAKKFFENSPIVNVPGEYTLKLHAVNGCDYSYIFQILGDFKKPEIEFEDIEGWGCKTEQLEIKLDTKDVNDYQVIWNSTDGIIKSDPMKKDIICASVGTYIVEFTNNKNGCSKKDSIKIETIGDIPEQINLDKKDITCFGANDGIIAITSIVGGQEPYSYEINNQSVQEKNENLNPGLYTLKVTDANGCSIQEQIMIDTPIEILGKIEGPYKGKYLDNIQLIANVDWSAYNITNINWYDESNNLIGTGKDLSFQLEKEENITLELIDAAGCIVKRQQLIAIDKEFNFFKPNAFSPNGDGANDLFFISSEKLPSNEYSMKIFDRWGNQVFANDKLHFNNSSEGWNGRYKGQKAQIGVYTYVIETILFNEKVKLVGDVTLLR